MPKKESKATKSLHFAFGRTMSRLEWGENCDDVIKDMKDALAKGADKTTLMKMLSILRECLGVSANQ